MKHPPPFCGNEIYDLTSPQAKVTMLYLVGLGLADEQDITMKGLSIVQKASRVYLEAYTSILLVDKEKLVSQLKKC